MEFAGEEARHKDTKCEFCIPPTPKYSSHQRYQGFLEQETVCGPSISCQVWHTIYLCPLQQDRMMTCEHQGISQLVNTTSWKILGSGYQRKMKKQQRK